jgi:hypothetical protein
MLLERGASCIPAFAEAYVLKKSGLVAGITK